MAEKKKISKAATTGVSEAGKPAKKIVKSTRKGKPLTAREATLLAWQKTYENRHKRLE